MPGGRKTLLTPEVEQAIIQGVRGGVRYVSACVLAGVDENTATLWRRRGEGRDTQQPATPRLVEFVVEVKKAEAENEAWHLARIAQASRGGAVIWSKTTTFPDGRVVKEEKLTEPQWTASAWTLERRLPDVYGKRERIDTRIDVQKSLKRISEETGMSAEEVLAEAKRLLQDSQ